MTDRGTVAMVIAGVVAFSMLVLITGYYSAKPISIETPPPQTAMAANDLLMAKKWTHVVLVNPEPITYNGFVFAYGTSCYVDQGVTLAPKGQDNSQTLFEIVAQQSGSSLRCPLGSLFFVQTREISELAFTKKEFDLQQQQRADKAAITKDRVRKILQPQ